MKSQCNRKWAMHMAEFFTFITDFQAYFLLYCTYAKYFCCDNRILLFHLMRGLLRPCPRTTKPHVFSFRTSVRLSCQCQRFQSANASSSASEGFSLLLLSAILTSEFYPVNILICDVWSLSIFRPHSCRPTYVLSTNCIRYKSNRIKFWLP